MTNDQQLLDRVQAGDVGALGYIYDRYGSLCLRYARRLAGPAAAEEAVFTAFISLWRRGATEDLQVASWLLTQTKLAV